MQQRKELALRSMGLERRTEVGWQAASVLVGRKAASMRVDPKQAPWSCGCHHHHSTLA